MEKGFVKRAKAVEALLGDPRSTFIVATTLEAAPAHEAGFLSRAVLDREYHLGAIIANRVLPSALTRRGAATSARRLGEAAADDELMAKLAGAMSAEGDPVEAAELGDVLEEVATRFHDVALVAAREAERRAELAELAPDVFDVPSLGGDVNDLAGLMTIAAHLRE
jgi:hypothetical protein